MMTVLRGLTRRHAGQRVAIVSHADPIAILRLGLERRPLTTEALHATVYPARCLRHGGANMAGSRAVAGLLRRGWAKGRVECAAVREPPDPVLRAAGRLTSPRMRRNASCVAGAPV